MASSKFFSGFWIGFTVILSIVFAVLFFPVAHENYSFGLSLFFTVLGLIVIWIVYFLRAIIFSRIFGKAKNRL